MFARIMTSSAKPDEMDVAIAEWSTHIAPFKATGLVAALLLADREQHRFLSITIWTSEEAQARNAGSPEQIAGRAAFARHLTGLPVASVYEVVGRVE